MPTPTPVVSGAVLSPSGSAATDPVIPGFYPDPTICKVGSDYYLANSSFEYFPGAPLFHSTDLVTWDQIGHIMSRRSQFQYGSDGPSTGVYGSTLRFHSGRFWFITTNVSTFDSGQLLLTADDPAGEWSDPIQIPDAIGIDPDIVWDDDGICYLTWNALDFSDGGRGILQATLDTTTGKLTSPAYQVWQGTGMVAPEGPHLYRIGDYWYLLLAEGGTERGHSVTVARGTSPSGPFESCPWNPIFTHRSSGHPVQNVGHADLVPDLDGGWAAVYLGARPHGSTPQYHVLGRETFLAGVDWLEGWPVFDEGRFQAEPVDTDFIDAFATPTLHHRWVAPTGEPDRIAKHLPEGGVALAGIPGQGGLCVRVRDLSWRADAVLMASGTFRVRIDDRHWYGLHVLDGSVTVEAQIGDIRSTVSSSPFAGGAVTVRIESVPPVSLPIPLGHGGPDDIVLSFDAGDGFHELSRLDGRYISTEVASGFTGRMLCVGAADAESRLLRVTYEKR
ncbi:glycoside hydrolase family 43 protein [Diaminobutyricibacter tongyongensis]|uniref:Glycoside hydrolase family 43 protein n=1 Tax=Leifsonia tongyongensis TaxID=1268043 RepID=A0A6L9XUK4_9MICO|nr:glycoside hydrolase family 43 protein [Diaminobutyricibacter tongyongensis]NEN04945.1 glycoside hydrolase family 43 protein [Diaminobutyricibacter tongyongensis]